MRPARDLQKHPFEDRHPEPQAQAIRRHDGTNPRHGSHIVLASTLATIVALLALLLPTTVAAGSFTLRVPVLMYHRITAPAADVALPDLWIPPKLFRRQMQALKNHGWTAITAEQLAVSFAAHERPGPKRFVITIDDGAIDGYTNVRPILGDLRMSATFFVNPGHVGRSTKMDWDELRELRAEGHDIANHSLSHADLTALSGTKLKAQIEGAERILAKQLGYRPVTFCYPYGFHDAEARAQVKSSGFVLAFTTAYGAREDSSHPYRAPRLRMHPSDSPADVLAKVAPYARGY
jgi:peptidoglycan/xylan/chitin deacetylase (PgdA/CDA1 family)